MLSFPGSDFFSNLSDSSIPSLNVTMKSFQFFSSLLLPLLSTYPDPAAAQLTIQTTPSLNVTAIASRDGVSAIECWQIPGFKASADKGTVGSLSLFLGDTANATYTVLPPRFDGGVHNAPVNQFVLFMSGLAHVTLPNTTISPTTSAWVQGGKYGLIIAADTSGVSKYGHATAYPSDADTVALQVPFKDGIIPDHTVLYDGPCLWSEMIGV
ncbi:hypothetical protein EG328_007946 [Venturia inaequalis]|uniref:Small secreted protein n=1 Tax=Venturia inaequalis TaxID=5025 RepID=A0A8H3YP48_VENIN|nr:hypothetical protein EG328_007946 [Venturia inaequalis]